MNTQPINENEREEQWATVELMGRGQTAGRIDMGQLLRVDVPLEDGKFRTEYYGISAIYKINLVSEEIARAYAQPVRAVHVYDAPIVTRDQHLSAMRQAERDNERLREQVHELERRLTAANHQLPAPLFQDSDEVAF